MEATKLYRGVLNFLDGRVEVVLMPAHSVKDGTALIPETISLGDRVFRLIKVIDEDISFEYKESQIEPYNNKLH